MRLSVTPNNPSAQITSLLAPHRPGEFSACVKVPVLLRLIQDISAVRLKLPPELSSPDQEGLVMIMNMVEVGGRKTWSPLTIGPSPWLVEVNFGQIVLPWPSGLRYDDARGEWPLEMPLRNHRAIDMTMVYGGG